MNKDTSIKLFENRKVRSLWDAEAEKWYISVVDVIEVLTESNRPRRYWDDLKRKLRVEGSELSEKIGQLKMQSADGKFYKTDVADVEQLFRLVQSIPSPKAEPFKIWLSQLARERLEEDNNMLAEASTTEISKEKQPVTFAENTKVARQGCPITAAYSVVSWMKCPVRDNIWVERQISANKACRRYAICNVRYITYIRHGIYSNKSFSTHIRSLTGSANISSLTL